MNHFTRFHKPEHLLKEFIIPFLAQFAILVLAIRPHRIMIALGSHIMEPVMVGDEMSDPTSGRLIFACCAMALCFILAFVVSRLAKKGWVYTPFFVGILAGTFLWQSIGEDMWNFGITEHGEVTQFMQLESIQVLPIVLPILALVGYGILHNSFDWGITCVIASFLCNWMGHYVSLGTYPLVSSVFEEEVWLKLAAFTIGGLVLLTGLYLGIFSAKDTKGRLAASLVLYIGVAVIVFGFV